MKKRTVVAVLLAGLSVLALPAAKAEDQPAAVAASAVDPAAMAALERLSQTLSSSRDFSFRSQSSREEVLSSGEVVNVFRSAVFDVQRPDRLLIRFDGDNRDVDLYYAAGDVTLVDRSDNIYAEMTVPATLDQAVQYFNDEADIPLPELALLLNDPYSYIKDGITRATVLGITQMGGKPLLHLSFSEEQADWQIWLDDTPQALPRRLAVIYKKLPGAPRVVTIFSDWKLKQSHAKGYFAYKPRKGATKATIAATQKQ